MKPKAHLTASKLYNYIQCPHRVWRDVHGDQSEKIQETNPFVQLLWDKGMQHEKEKHRLGSGFVTVINPLAKNLISPRLINFGEVWILENGQVKKIIDQN